MSYCPTRASHALLIGLEYILSEVVVCCLSIAQRAPVWERESRSVPQVRPYGRTVMKSGLRWSATWLKEAAFCYRWPIGHWVLAAGIDRFPITMPDHADSSGFVVRISPRGNPDERVVVDGVPISGHTGPLIGSVTTGCLITVWNVIAEFLRRRGNSKPIVIMGHSSCSWVERSRSSYSSIMNDNIIVDPRSHDFTRTNLSASPPFLTRLCRRLIVRYLEYEQREHKLIRSISGEHEIQDLNWFSPFRK
jgi:hypothetical protein